jgi:DNA invertase Pin-like site-specific DNA recombinase
MRGCLRTTSKHCRRKREEPPQARRRETSRLISCCFGAGPRSLLDLVTTLQELMALAVGFVSLSEALDVTTPSGRAIKRCEGDATTRYTKD